MQIDWTMVLVNTFVSVNASSGIASCPHHDAPHIAMCGPWRYTASTVSGYARAYIGRNPYHRTLENCVRVVHALVTAVEHEFRPGVRTLR